MELWLILLPLFCIVYWFLQKWMDKLSGLPPGPFRYPVIGCLVQILREDPVFPFIAFQKLAKRYGNVISLQMGVVRGVAICGYEAVTEFYRNDDCIGRIDEKWTLDRTFGKPLGLISSHVNIWRETRRFTSRTLREFGFGVNKSMESLIQDELDEFSSYISDRIKSSDGILSVEKLFHKPILNSTWCLVSGNRFLYSDPGLEELLRLIGDFIKSGSFGAGLLTCYPFLVDYTPKLIGFDKQVKSNRATQKYLKEMLMEVRARGEYLSNPSSFIDVYLEKIDTWEQTGTIEDVIYSDENLISILYDFLFGAAETASNTLGFALLYMILNEDIQMKVREEIDSVIGSQRRPTLADKEKMPYTEATFLEFNRLANVVPIGPRKLECDVTIGKFKIPKGTTIFLNNYSVAMDPEVWGDPHVFRPERFLSRSTGKIINADKFFPFGTGKRNCIGESVAKAAMFIFFTGLLQQFNFTINPAEAKPTTIPVLGFTLSPKPFTMIVTPRH